MQKTQTAEMTLNSRQMKQDVAHTHSEPPHWGNMPMACVPLVFEAHEARNTMHCTNSFVAGEAVPRWTDRQTEKHDSVHIPFLEGFTRDHWGGAGRPAGLLFMILFPYH